MTFDRFLQTMGSNIARTRKAQSLTQRDAAKKIGISYRYFQNIEGGSANVTLLTLYRVARFFNLHITDLIPNRTSLE